MIRRFNYTARKRINREDVDILLTRSADSAPVFDISLDLGKYALPSDGVIFVEAYRRTTLMRFQLGTVAKIITPEDRRLTEFDKEDGILFRVRVSSETPDRGKLLAEADRLAFRKPDETEEDRIPLLPVQSADLGYEISKIDFGDDPVLLMNSAIGSWRDVARSSVFASLVYPSAFREILFRITRIEEFFDTDELDDWRCKWLTYATQLPGVGDVPDEDSTDQDVELWIDDAVKVFTQKCQMYDRFKAFWEGDLANEA